MKNISENQKKLRKEFTGGITWRVVIFGVLMILIFIAYCQIKERIIEKKEFFILQPSENIVYQVECIKENGKKLELEGFIFQTSANTNKKDKMIVLLHDMESGKNISMDSKKKQRDDINKYFECEYDYSNSGFHASINKDRIDMERGHYQVYLYFESSVTRGFIALKEYLINGQLCHINVISNPAFDFTGTELDDLLENADVCVSRIDFGMCVYQKDNALYWVANEKFNFAENGLTYIQFQMNTTQVERLPAERLENKWYWSNLGFNFESYELNGNYGEFRVAKMELPTEYSITDIWTGYHNGLDWEWIEVFYPIYNSNFAHRF